MSDILWLTQNIRETSAHIAQLEKAILDNPEESGLVFNLRSIQKRFNSLQNEFAEETNKEFLDICSYRIIADEDAEYPLSAVGAALSGFQSVIEIFLDAALTGPKTRARVSSETASLASLNFAYSYPGSLGFVLTIPNERLLLVESELDMAIANAFKVITASSTNQLAEFAHEVGVASIRRIYDWASNYAKYNWSAEIEWKRGTEVRDSLLAQAPLLQRLTYLIEQTSDETEDRVSISGKLVGIDEKLRTFHLEVPEGEDPDIKGHVSDSISFDPPISVPRNVRADLMKRVKVHYAYEQEEKYWELVGLK